MVDVLPPADHLSMLLHSKSFAAGLRHAHAVTARMGAGRLCGLFARWRSRELGDVQRLFPAANPAAVNELESIPVAERSRVFLAHTLNGQFLQARQRKDRLPVQVDVLPFGPEAA